MRFSEKLTLQRKKNNLSQEQLADSLGVSRQAVSKWESGVSYPDMDKIIKISKILNCTLEDLLDDGTIGETKKKERIKIKSYLQEVLEFITRTYNMFISMSTKQKIKCIFEVICLGIFLWILGAIVVAILSEITYQILEFIPWIEVKDAINNILESIYIIIILIFGVIILLHLFKIRYLNYYITIEDQNASRKQIEKEVGRPENKREKIIIRDPVHATPHFFKILEKGVILFLKILAIWFIIPIIFTFIFFIILGVISLCHIKIGILFFLVAILFLSISLLCFLLIYLIYNFIFDRKQNMKFVFITMISSFLLIGISIGLSIVVLLTFQEVKNMEGLNTITRKETIKMNENINLVLQMSITEENVQYEIDNSKENIELEITTSENIDYELTHVNQLYYLHLKEMSISTAYHILIEDMKAKRLRDYTSDELMKVKITLSESNYEILNKNHSQIEKDK